MAERTVTREEIYGILSQWLQAITQGVPEILEVQETESELIIRRPLAQRLSDLKGLGKSLWEQLDVEQYLEEERSSWERSI
ncbi:MAG: hypothetical protein HYY20_10575 [Candidatus Tectomicrobia bacterium]|uniref:Uncharacterized protein n=1 Tax=Tectimicrobiota bacterium TaxID=2528274 RepID=A0A932CPU5_UNCTE|nr:hypothetical protein [Candidatus Tectomicrobia bacterium]